MSQFWHQHSWQQHSRCPSALLFCQTTHSYPRICIHNLKTLKSQLNKTFFFESWLSWSSSSSHSPCSPFAPTSLAPLHHYPIVPGALPSAALTPRTVLLQTKRALPRLFSLWSALERGICGCCVGKEELFCSRTAFPGWILLGMPHLWHLGWAQGSTSCHWCWFL